MSQVNLSTRDTSQTNIFQKEEAEKKTKETFSGITSSIKHTNENLLQISREKKEHITAIFSQMKESQTKNYSQSK